MEIVFWEMTGPWLILYYCQAAHSMFMGGSFERLLYC